VDQTGKTFGTVVSVDTTANTLTLSIGSENGPPTQKTFSITSATTITRQDSAVTLASLTAGTNVYVKFSTSAPTVATSIYVVVPPVRTAAYGKLVSVDTTANTITPGGDAGKTTTWPIDPTASVTLNGVASTLGALPIGASVKLQLTSDGKTALTIAASAEYK